MGQSIAGVVRRVLVASESDSIVSVAQPRVEVTLEGFRGDKHAGFARPSDSRTPWYPRGTMIRNSRQVTILSEEELAEVSAIMGLPEIKIEWLGGNLLLSGIPDLTHLPTGLRLFFSRGAVLVVEAENLPCITAGRSIQQNFPDRTDLAQRFPKDAIGRRGLAAWVECPGVIFPGDEVRLELP